MIAQASMFCTYTHELDQFFSVRRTCDLDGSWAAWTEDNCSARLASFGYFLDYWASYGHYWSHSHSWAQDPRWTI